MPTFVLPFPLVNPILVQWGPLAIRWYALAYIVGLIAGWALIRRVVADDSLWGGAPRPSRDSIDDLLVYCALGVVIGGRLGNVLFYDPGYYFSHPWEILKVWKGGMAFHGGLIGASIGIGRLVTAEEVATVVAFLASPKSVALNGDAITASGGNIGPIYY